LGTILFGLHESETWGYISNKHLCVMHEVRCIYMYYYFESNCSPLKKIIHLMFIHLGLMLYSGVCLLFVGFGVASSDLKPVEKEL